MIDISKLLQLDYLKEFVSRYYTEIGLIEQKKIDLYSLDIILSMENPEIIDLFTGYDLKYDNILEKKESDFLDDDWEFSDLFEEELSYASKEKSKLDAAAWNEVLELNNKIEQYNNELDASVIVLKKQIRFVELIIRMLETDELIYGDDINELKRMILSSSLIDDRDRFEVNLIVVNYLIDSKKEIIFSKENVKTDDFDNVLAEIHDTSTFGSSNNDSLIKLPYQDKILKYSVTYKSLIESAGFSNIFDLMETFNDVSVDFYDEYLSSDDFCLQLGYLLYQLCHINDMELEKEILNSLKKLDVLYKQDNKNSDRKREMLEEIDVFNSRINEIDIDLFNKLKVRLKVLKSNLTEIIGDERIKQLEIEFNDIKRYMDNLTEILYLVKNVNEYNQVITEIFNSFSLNSVDSENLSVLQSKLLNFEKELFSDKDFGIVNSEFKDCFIMIDEIKKRLISSKYVDKSADMNNSILLKGFVLCDFDSDNQPYILSDLMPRSKMIDIMIQPKDLQNGFDAFGKLINDLFLLGNIERLYNSDSHGFNNDKLCQPIYWGVKNRSSNNETGIYRLKYDRNGVERFVEQRIVLYHDSIIYKQFVDIVKEIIPNVYFDDSSDINLYINYASAMRVSDDSFYNIAINRFDRKSSLYRLFNEPKNKTELSESECDLLREIIHNSLDAFLKLEKYNSNLSLDLIKQMGGGKNRG